MKKITDVFFTQQETEVIRSFLHGNVRKQIADGLKITIATVDTHFRHIHAKTGTHSQAELISYLIRTNYLQTISENKPKEIPPEDAGT